MQLPWLTVQQGDAAEGKLFRAEIQVGQANIAIDHPGRLMLGRQDAQFVGATLEARLITPKGARAAADVAGQGVMAGAW